MDVKTRNTIAFCVITLAVFVASSILARRPINADPAVGELPETIDGWKAKYVQFDRALLTSWLGTDSMVFREYVNTAQGVAVVVYAAYYPDMDASDRAHAPEVCYPGQGWTVRRNAHVDILLDGDIPVSVKRMVVEKGTDREVVYSWWQTSDGIIAENWQYRLRMVTRRLLGRETSSVWVRISAPESGPGGPPADRVLQSFARQMYPLLMLYFPNRA